MWWWLSPTRVSKRAGLPAGSSRRTSPARANAASTSYTAWVEIEPSCARAPSAISSTVAWSPARAAASTASR